MMKSAVKAIMESNKICALNSTTYPKDYSCEDSFAILLMWAVSWHISTAPDVLQALDDNTLRNHRISPI